MRIGSGGMLGMLLLAALAPGGGACQSSEPVIPFMDAGDPCANASTTFAIDCAQFPDTTCTAEGTSCPRQTYGCADAAYFTKFDYSQCPPEAGGNDAAQLRDVSLFGDDASGVSDATASDSGDASGDSSGD
jgi:hypothetical protein